MTGAWNVNQVLLTAAENKDSVKADVKLANSGLSPELSISVYPARTGDTAWSSQLAEYADEYDYYQEQKIRFYIKSTGNQLKEFLTLAKNKNPDFRFKNWFWAFDLKD